MFRNTKHFKGNVHLNLQLYCNYLHWAQLYLLCAMYLSTMFEKIEKSKHIAKQLLVWILYSNHACFLQTPGILLLFFHTGSYINPHVTLILTAESTIFTSVGDIRFTTDTWGWAGPSRFKGEERKAQTCISSYSGNKVRRQILLSNSPATREQLVKSYFDFCIYF